MADKKVAVTPGSGEDVAFSTLGGTLGDAQIVKIDLGADGASSALVRGQQTAANSLPVVTATDDPAAVSLAVLDDWDESDRAKVNPIVGQAGVQGGSGAVSAATQRVVLATDVALPAGTNAIGKLAANSGVDIGDVDVTSVPTDPFGANADAASATGSISAKLRGIATALGITAFDLGSGTGGSRTLRWFQDTAQWIGGAGSVSSATQRVTLASDDPAVASLSVLDDWDSSDAAKTVGFAFSCSTDVTRPAADTTQYSANDALSDSTSAPTSGGFTFTSAARASGGSGIITDAIITTDNDSGTPLQGEIWLFNTSVTNINDNSAFAVSDSEIKTVVGKIPFALEDAGNNGFAHVSGLNITFTCSGSANLRFLVRVKNAYTPVGSEVLTFKIAGVQLT